MDHLLSQSKNYGPRFQTLHLISIFEGTIHFQQPKTTPSKKKKTTKTIVSLNLQNVLHGI